VKNKRVFLICLLGLALMAQGVAHATPIQVDNPSFENDQWNPSWYTAPGIGYYESGISGWNTPPGGGTWIPIIPGVAYDTIPDGSKIAIAQATTISQILTSNLQVGDYTLKVYVGDRKDNSGFPGYAVQLYAGGNSLVSDSSLTPNNGWLLDTLHYHATSSSPGLGQPLQIRLTAVKSQVNFDDVTLDYSSAPIPGSVLLLGSGLLGLVFWRRKRNVL
jgi:hypothetical protein